MISFQRVRWFSWATLAVVGSLTCLSQPVRAQAPVVDTSGRVVQSRSMPKALLSCFSVQEETAPNDDTAPIQDAPRQTEPAPAASCLSEQDMGKYLAPITNISLDISHKSDKLPKDCYAEYYPESSSGTPFVWGRRSAVEYDFYWAAFGLVHNPLYFEDVPLERYGTGYSPVVQPVVSAAKFCGNVAILPYRIGLDSPHQLDYTLGYYRPGSWAPSVRPHLPWSWKGATLQAGAMTGFLYMFP